MGEYLRVSINESAPITVRPESFAVMDRPDLVATKTETFPVDLGTSVTVFNAAKPVFPAVETPVIPASASRPDFWQQASSIIKRHKPELALGGLGATTLACRLSDITFGADPLFLLSGAVFVYFWWLGGVKIRARWGDGRTEEHRTINPLNERPDRKKF